MKHSPFTKVLAGILCAIMLLGAIPLTAFAASAEEFKSETHTVFKDTESTLTPGVTQNIKYAYSSDDKQMVYYIATADVTRDDVVVQTSYKDQYTSKTFGMQKLTEQIAYANKLYTDKNSDRYISDYYNVVAGVNASFYNMTTGQPSGITYLDGVQIGESSSYAQFFAMTKDGQAVIDYTKNVANYKDSIDQAVAGSQMLVWEGKDVTANTSGSYNTDRHSRTCVGVTADGKVVMMVLDGRQEPFSCGGTMHELAQIMLEAGCVAAINLDGGGSTTYVSKAEGADEVALVNRPSDGSERTISSGLIIASLAVPSDTFDHVSMTVSDEYVTPGTSTTVKVTGVSAVGSAAVIPNGITYEVTNGTYENGVLTATTVGDVVLSAKYEGQKVGSVTIHAVEPTAISFTQTKKVISYGKTVSFDIKATVNNGLNDVKFKESDIVLMVSNANLGTVTGLSYTAIKESSNVTNGVITAQLVSNTTVSATINIELTNLPDTPVVYENFESKPEYTFSARYADYYKYEIVDKTTGQVRNGNYALAVTMYIDDEDYGLNQYSGFVQVGASKELDGYENVMGTKNFEDLDLTNAKRLGIWIYIPEDSQTSYVQFRLRNKDNYNNQLQYRLYDYGYSTTEMGHRGWRYFALDFDEVNTDSVKYNDGSFYLERIDFYSCTRNDETNQKNYGYDVHDQQSIKGNMTFYLDDLTVEYVDTGVDFVDPKFDYVKASYGGASDSIDLNGQTITSNVISVTARATDEGVGIDSKSAKAYIDGVELTGGFRCDELGIMTIDDVTLADGTHTFTFVISDKNGNCEYVTRQVTVNANSDIPTASLELAEELTSRPLFGQVLWFNLKVDNIEKVDTLTTILNLNATSTWELDHMVVANGFKASYTVDPITNDATITIKKDGKTSLSGTDVIAQIPTRMHYISSTSGRNWSYIQPEDLKLSMDKGLVVYSDQSQSTFSMKKVDIDSERYNWYDVMNENGDIVEGYYFHIHSACTISDKSATCTESGYTGRTYCETCKSVVDWGTTIEATGHSYELTDGVLKCHCGETFSGVYTDGKTYENGVIVAGWHENSYYVNGVKLTGVQKVDGYYYDFGTDGISKGKYTGLFYDETDKVYRYAQFGELSSGWKMIDDEWYYFRQSTLAAVTGEYTYSGITYTFNNEGRLTSGVWVTNDKGSRYYYAASYYYKAGSAASVTFVTIGGKEYGFDKSGYAYKNGLYSLKLSNQKHLTFYTFDETGVCTGLFDLSSYTGLVKTINEGIYYYENGELSHAGIVKIDGNYYYAGTGGVVVTNTSKLVYPGYTNGLIDPGTYEFDECGRIAYQNGVYQQDGKFYYFKNGQKTHAGMIEFDGNLYYAGTGGVVVTNASKLVYYGYTNGLVPPGTYEFGEDGKLLLLNGIHEINGTLYYFVNGIKTHAGVIKIDGAYYYAATGGLIVRNTTKVVYSDYTNDLVVPGTYTFDVDGKMQCVDGVYEQNGALYYFEKGVKTHAGIVKIDGEIYYAGTGGLVVAGTSKLVYPGYTNGIVPPGTYEFDTDGKMKYANGIHEINGTLYYFVDAVKTHAGVVKIDDSYYYAATDGVIVRNTSKFIYFGYANGLIAPGTYNFDINGRMIIE